MSKQRKDERYRKPARRAPPAGRQVCRVCGCWDLEPCMNDWGTCWWVEPDLCSFCTEPVEQEVRRVA